MLQLHRNADLVTVVSDWELIGYWVHLDLDTKFIFGR